MKSKPSFRKTYFIYSLILFIIGTLSMRACAQMPPGLQKRVDKYYERSIDHITGAATWAPKIKYSIGSAVFLTILDDSVLFIVSQYIGENWIFHTRIMSRVNGTLYQTTEADKSYIHRSVFSTASVYERVYTINGTDNGLINAIYNLPSTQLDIRLMGGDGIKDITLKERDLEMYRTGYELYLYLNQK